MDTQIQKQLEDILPEDIARTFESAYHVIQGNNDHMEDLLRHGGALLRKASQRLKPTQLVIGIAVLAVGAVIVLSKYSDQIQDAIEDMTDGDDSKPGAGQGQGNANAGGAKPNGDQPK
ncbi:hypothetical protein [Hymenobacter coalescens]